MRNQSLGIYHTHTTMGMGIGINRHKMEWCFESTLYPFGLLLIVRQPCHNLDKASVFFPQTNVVFFQFCHCLLKEKQNYKNYKREAANLTISGSVLIVLLLAVRSCIKLFLTKKKPKKLHIFSTFNCSSISSNFLSRAFLSSLSASETEVFAYIEFLAFTLKI